jgi:hypothetical protein
MAFGGCPFCKSIGSIGIASLAPAGRRDQCPVIAVGGEYAMEAGKIDARVISRTLCFMCIPTDHSIL